MQTSAKTNEESDRRQLLNIELDLRSVQPLFDDPTLTDIFISVEGKISSKRFGKPIQDETKYKPISISDRFKILNEITKYMGIVINFNTYPVLESTIPVPLWENARITGIYPPWTTAPEFTIRRPPKKIYSLEEYVQNNQLTQERYDIIVNYLKNKKNIIVSGSTGSGKTTMVNALIQKKQELYPNDRYFIIQDTSELKCTAKYNTMIILRPDQAVSAVLLSLRYTPDTIIFGEVRKSNVMVELLDAWNTGHPGGVTTIHANSSKLTLTRINKMLFTEYRSKDAMPDLNEYIDLIIYIQKDKTTGIVINDVMEMQKRNTEIEAIMETVAKMDVFELSEDT